MEIKIGMQNVLKEIVVKSDLSEEDLHNKISEALSKSSFLELKDVDGRHVMVQVSLIGYIELGTQEHRKVGFGNS